MQSLQLKPEDTLLIRGGTSSIGITAAQIAKNLGCKVYATSRNIKKADVLKEIGVDEIIIDSGEIANQVRATNTNGVDKVLELVGGNGIRDSLKCTKQ